MVFFNFIKMIIDVRLLMTFIKINTFYSINFTYTKILNNGLLNTKHYSAAFVHNYNLR